MIGRVEDSKLYIKAKIKKLLALSGSPNEHEARRALAKAQELMLKHSIELHKLEHSGRNNVASRRIHFWRGSCLVSEAWMIADLAREYCCEYDTYHSGRVTYVILFGSETDLDVAEAAVIFAWRTFRHCWLAYYKSQSSKRKTQRKTLRMSYCYGFVTGIAETNRKNRQEHGLVLTIQPEVQDAKTKHQRQELIRFGIDPDKQISEVKPKIKRKRTGIRVDNDAIIQGYVDGRSVHRKDQLTIFPEVS